MSKNSELSSPEPAPKYGRLTVPLLLGTLIVGGCTTSANSEEITKMPPVVRFSHDYANGWESGPATFDGSDARASGQEGCLDGSPYDPFNGDRTPSASVLTTPQNTLQVIPTNELAGAPKLTFQLPEGSAAADGAQPLVPADQQTRGVLAAYGCETETYPRYEK